VTVHNGRLFTHQLNVALIDRQTIEARAVQRAKASKCCRAFCSSSGGVAAEAVRALSSRAAACFLTVAGVLRNRCRGRRG
jgi:hypothetical protein